MRSESLNPVVSVHNRDRFKAPLPTRTRVRPMTRAAISEAAPKHPLPDRPRVVRMPSDWWDAPSVVALALANEQAGDLEDGSPLRVERTF